MKKWAFLLAAAALALVLWRARRAEAADAASDDAGGRPAEAFPELAADPFQPMDGGLALDPDEIKGRNTWILWCGGDEQFWDGMARGSYGLIDLLKTLDSRQRGSRFRDMGLINEPGYRAAGRPDDYGLWLDEAGTPESAAIDPLVYGRSSGVMGFRLFPNPAFDDAARRKWDSARYYADPAYAQDPGLVRPYRVGVSCGACHVAFNPCRPPDDPEAPRWDNLASAIGNQYLREGRVFAHNAREGGFFWEMLNAQPAGTSDTSRIANDHINNPSAINPIFELASRLEAAHREVVSGDTLLLPGEQPVMDVPHILKDGADSVGFTGAVMRVYVNIGMDSQYWLTRHNALIGLAPQRPFQISAARKNSVYWRATEGKAANVAKFFARLQPMRLADAPGGKAYLVQDSAVLDRGRRVFGGSCAGCHSSRQPPAGAEPKAWFAQAVARDGFDAGNFFSNEARYPVTKIGTNAARALGTNAEKGHVWDNFSSDTYKALASAGTIQVYNPFTGGTDEFRAPAGGPGYYRTPSLINLWSSAPFFHNNALGKYTGDPSVAGRMEAFNDAVEKLLWPERRLGKASIWRTSRECDLRLEMAVVPEPLRALLRPIAGAEGSLAIGPIPAGTPINLIANIDPSADPAKLLALVLKMREVFGAIKVQHLGPDATSALMAKELGPALLAVSKCPDFIEDRGHTFGASLAEADKRALIEYLKTL